MFELSLTGLRHITCLGAHCDDIEIGAGGTITRLIERNPDVHVDWIVFSSNAERKVEAANSARAWLAGSASQNVQILEFEDRFFPDQWRTLKEEIGRLRATADPDLVFTHYRQDLHQDHRTIAELTWNAFRDTLVLEYEIPKYDGDLGQPNFYMPLTRAQLDTKITALHEHFPSQTSKPWFDAELFRSLPRVRGIECNAPDGYAEAFHARKVRLA